MLIQYNNYVNYLPKQTSEFKQVHFYMTIMILADSNLRA